MHWSQQSVAFIADLGPSVSVKSVLASWVPALLVQVCFVGSAQQASWSAESSTVAINRSMHVP
jgi:hypothetical protein